MHRFPPPVTRLLKTAWALGGVLLTTAHAGSAQSLNGTVTGRVIDSQQIPVSGVTVTAESANVQGARTAVTSGTGDYSLMLLPSGTYKLTFELSGQRAERNVTLAPTQVLTLDVVIAKAAPSKITEPVASSADVLVQTTRLGLNINQNLLATLPTARDLDAALLIAPGLHATGPNGSHSVAGSVSFENRFLVDGVTIDDRHRQTDVPVIEDAVQETTVVTGGVSAENGRFTGGVVNIVTRSGGNFFSGSFRETLNSDGWRELTKFDKDLLARPGGIDTRLKQVVPMHEYTFGGPAAGRRVWFFTAGRFQTQREGRQLAATLSPYELSHETKHFSVKGTYAAASNHRFRAAYTGTADRQTNVGQTSSMDLRNLYDLEAPQDLFAANYNAVVLRNLFIEADYSRRKVDLLRSGTRTGLVDGTLMIDDARGLQYWSPAFCGACTPEKLENTDIFLKGSYSRAAADSGSHTLVFGYENFDHSRLTDTHQSGSDFRILGTSTIMRGTGAAAVIYPVLLGNNTTRIQWNPVIPGDGELHFRTNALFFSDNWRMNRRVTTTFGFRWDRNDGWDRQGKLIARSQTLSPRIGIVVDPQGNQRWSIVGGFARYVTSMPPGIADVASAAGSPQTFRFFYQGPDINANPAGPLISTPDAIRQVFAWFNANGGTSRPFADAPIIPGVSPKIRGTLDSPTVLEHTAGVNRQWAAGATLRIDYVFRDYRGLYALRTDTRTGRVATPLGNVDLALLVNSNVPQRQYRAVNAQMTYRYGSRFDMGGAYTLSSAWGNFDAENATHGGFAADFLQYPEYRQASWNYPEGALQIDQRHRARAWASYGLPWVNGLVVSGLEIFETGVPYGVSNINNSSANGLDPRPFATDSGYLTPPTGADTLYFYTSRDFFRTEGQKRTDLAVNYSRRIGPANRPATLFVQGQIVNLFGNEQLCACGGSVFANGGGVALGRIDQSVMTSVNRPTLYLPFDPFTTRPTQGVNWEYGPNFGKALNRFAYTSPRQFRITFGVRF